MKNNGEFDFERLYDVIIIGGGPAGLTAAIYLSRAKYRVLVLEKEQFGGQITITDEVVNYPGIERTDGKRLTQSMLLQAQSFGAECILAQATEIILNGNIKTVRTQRGEYYCLGILLATGAHPRTIGFKGEAEHKGRGVAYCATCDGEFFTDKEIFVVGGGYAAAEESVFLTKFAKHITVLVRESDFTCAASVADKAKSNDKITVLTNTVVEEVSGDNCVNYIRYKNTKTNEFVEYRADEDDYFGVFVFAGYSPETDLVKETVSLNEHGYIITDNSQKTSCEGIYAAGDVCIKPLRQVVTATGDGALAATELEKYVADIQESSGIYPKKPVIKINNDGSFSEDTLNNDKLFSDQMTEQLNTVFDKMENNLILNLYLDSTEVSAELESFIAKLCELTDKISFEVQKDTQSDELPYVEIKTENGESKNLSFHGIPSGHEFTSFVLALYNASGRGQRIDSEIYEEITALDKPVKMQIFVSLSCTMCPDLVVACQKIASLNGNISADVYDIKYFPQLKKRFNVMSVPCLVINDDKVHFGKKNIGQVLDLIKQL